MLPNHLNAEETPHVNMTPMVDVVLCLLIFFMVATRLYDWDENQFNVRVPQVSDAAPLAAAPEDLELTILAPGQVVIGERTLDLEQLTEVLTEARQGYAEQGVLVRGDARLSYQDVADVLAACEAAGIQNVRLPVRPRSGEPSPRP